MERWPHTSLLLSSVTTSMDLGDEHTQSISSPLRIGDLEEDMSLLEHQSSHPRTGESVLPHGVV